MTDSIYATLRTYAYNILGSYDDASDIVQDVMEKFIGLDKSSIDNTSSYLIKMTINYAINYKKRSKKFSIYGTWLPEPIYTDSTDHNLLKDQVADYTMLVLFEKLNVKERAVFVLKEAFDYKHDEIAKVLDMTAVNSRKILGRAKAKLGEKSIVHKAVSKHKIKPYLKALKSADIQKLEALFSSDITLMADGGNSVKVVTRLTQGIENTAQILQYIYAMFLDNKPYELTTINHLPAIVYKLNGITTNCMIFEFDDNEKLRALYSMVDPEKLKRL